MKWFKGGYWQRGVKVKKLKEVGRKTRETCVVRYNFIKLTSDLFQAYVP
jgi:hypothetical protein